MKLTPLDIRHKEFKRGMRGYADVEVDEFLDQIADEYERLFKENIDLQDRVESLEEKVAGYRRIEETLQKTLVNAQASAEEQKQNANKQAQLVLQDAELKARQLVNEAYSERQAIEQSMAKLRSAEEDFRFKFRQLLDGYLRQLQDAPEVAEAPPASDFSRHTAAIKEAIAREAAPARPEPTPAPSAVTPEPAEGVADAPVPAEEPVAAPDPPAATEDEHEPDPEPEPERRYVIPGEPAVVPQRGRSGVQAGVHTEPAPSDGEGRPDRPREDDPEVTAAHPAPEGAPDDEGRQKRRSRILFGESDDLLADVDTGVNEDEFKW
ncbi:MAG TPA: DivIVA domain-containing protein [Thermoleophilia bacterium]|nr:DivIVA domain-containing protein [Thermoleophilia bacterium]